MWTSSATLTLPDGRKIRATEVWDRDYDVNAVTVHSQTIEWADSGEELTAEEQEELIEGEYLYAWASTQLENVEAEPFDIEPIYFPEDAI